MIFTKININANWTIRCWLKLIETLNPANNWYHILNKIIDKKGSESMYIFRSIYFILNSLGVFLYLL